MSTSLTPTLGKCPPEVQAGCVLAAGLTSAATLGLYARGYKHEALAIMVAATVLGAVLSAAKVLEGDGKGFA